MSFDPEFQSRYLEKFANEMRRAITFSDYGNWMESIRESFEKIIDADIRSLALAKLAQISSDVRLYDSFDEIPDDFKGTIADDIIQLSDFIKEAHKQETSLDLQPCKQIVRAHPPLDYDREI
jgi:hypothetical protein